MTIFCIRVRRPGEPAWQFMGRGRAVTARRSLALTWDCEHQARRWVPHFARELPGREWKVAPVTAIQV